MAKERGLAKVDPEKRIRIARKGGKAAHRNGTAHTFKKGAEARRAGRKGGIEKARRAKAQKEQEET
jgi:uncharacterized protein